MLKIAGMRGKVSGRVTPKDQAERREMFRLDMANVGEGARSEERGVKWQEDVIYAHHRFAASRP